MQEEKIPWSMFTKVVGGLGLFIVFCPSAVILAFHRFPPGAPGHVAFLTRVLLSACGLLVCLIGLIPTLIRMNRSE